MCVYRRPRVFDGVTDRRALSSLNAPQAPTSSIGRRRSSGASGLELLTRLPTVSGHSVRLLKLRIISLTGDLYLILIGRTELIQLLVLASDTG